MVLWSYMLVKLARAVCQGLTTLSQDMLFEKSDYNQFTSITTPKVPGAWNLHHCTPKDMDFFIMLGSASGIIGNRGQGAYAATCAFLNAFAQYRASQGLPATCIDIGLVEDVGYAAEQWQLKAWLDTLYSEYVKEKELHAVIQAAINGQMENGISCVIGMRLRPNDPEFFWTPDPKFRHLRRGVYTPENTISTETSKISVGQALKQASSAGEAVQSVVDSLMVKMSSVLMVPMEDMSPRRSMTEYGLDSLVAVEIRNWISREMGAKVPLLTLLSSPSIERLADTIAKQSSLVDSKLFATAEEKE
jgi:acyl carrier protein